MRNIVTARELKLKYTPLEYLPYYSRAQLPSIQ